MKRIAAAVLCALMIFVQMPTVHAVGTSASSAILVEAGSGRVLYEQNAHERRLIASITKLMTALVALESDCDLQESFPVPREAVGVEGSSIYLKDGEEITLETLLYGLMLASGNDAALAVAIRCGGDLDGFVAKMNEKARELGMENTHFANPNGLNAEDHYSTAYDMALLARACLENETLAKIVATRSITIGQRTFTNHNKLLQQYEGCIGMKTGYTKKAGRTLVSAAKRGGMTLVAVTLNDGDDWKDHAALFDWGFEHYALVNVCRKGNKLGRVPVSGSLVPCVYGVAGGDFSYPLTAEERLEVERLWDVQRLNAPVERGAVLGRLRVSCNGSEVASIPIVTAEHVYADLVPKQRVLERITQYIF